MTDSPTILVVDDEAIVAAVIEDFLVDAGYRVVLAYDGAAAIRALDTHPAIRGVVTDIRMPGELSGWDVAREARKRLPSMPIVYASGDSTSVWKALGVPNSVMLGKPFAAAQLVTAISALLNAPDAVVQS